jgi:hypothetical protein
MLIKARLQNLETRHEVIETVQCRDGSFSSLISALSRLGFQSSQWYLMESWEVESEVIQLTIPGVFA